MGLPIIASDLPYTRKILKEAGCGILVSPDKAKEYVDAAVYLLENPYKFKAFQESGFKVIESKYSWDNERKKLIELFNDLIKNTNKRVTNRE